MRRGLWAWTRVPDLSSGGPECGIRNRNTVTIAPEVDLFPMRATASAPCRTLLACALFVLGSLSGLDGQGSDPRSDFLNALGQFSLSLDGTYGDEGQRLSNGLDSMAAALSQWDALIQSRERAMAADIGNADPKLASRMHLALGALYLDRLRVSDAVRELAAARASDPTRSEVPLFQWLVHTQMTGDTSAATEALRAAHALSPQDATRTYLLGRQLIDGNRQETAASVAPTRPPRPRRRGGERNICTLHPARYWCARARGSIHSSLRPRTRRGSPRSRRATSHRPSHQLRESARRDPLTTLRSEGDPLARAAAAFRGGLVDEARKQLETALTQSPDRAEAHRILGMVDLADGETTRGLGQFREASGSTRLTSARAWPSPQRARGRRATQQLRRADAGRGTLPRAPHVWTRTIPARADISTPGKAFRRPPRAGRGAGPETTVGHEHPLPNDRDAAAGRSESRRSGQGLHRTSSISYPTITRLTAISDASTSSRATT